MKTKKQLRTVCILALISSMVLLNLFLILMFNSGSIKPDEIKATFIATNIAGFLCEGGFISLVYNSCKQFYK